jgi:hypothetical protein
MRRGVKIGSLMMAAVMGAVLSTQAQAVDIERPRIQIVDKFGVNMVNGQATHTLTTVSIGGAMGLSHSVSVIANEFNFTGNRGFQDKFYARARNVNLCNSPGTCSPMNVMSVSDFSGSTTFAYYVGGVLQQGGSATSGYSYVATSDERHTLEVVGNEFLWIKPDGTEVRFNRFGSGVPASQGGLLTSVKYPNGFTITVDPGSVNTNTGFQIKYFFEPDNRPLDKTEPPGLLAPLVNSGWQLLNPKYVRGINAAIEHCPWTVATCTPVNNWPTATFEWPAGMPRTMFIGDSIAKVTDAAGLTTQYKFRAYDLAYHPWGHVVEPYVPGTEFSPRIIEITPGGATAPLITYDYNNVFSGGWLDARLQTAGVVKLATRLGASASYDMQGNYQGDGLHLATGQGGVPRVHMQNYFAQPSGIYYVDTEDGRVWHEENGRNFVRQFDRQAAPVERYTYATRSNLTGVTYNEGTPEGYSIAAEYPATCTPTTRKTCNQATRIRDANGNWTDYTYHAPSGQIETITLPADKNGFRAQTRYTYEERYATYFNSAGVKVQSTQPIWLKTVEEYCIRSSAAGGNCTEPNDEVVTTYEYNHNNLLMTGMVVTAPGGPARRTCYRYDIYGNQIGVTTPNAALGSCPGGAP